MSANDVIARLRAQIELVPRNSYRVVELLEALPALLECASALEQLLDDLGQLAPAEPSIQAVEEARAALQALSQTTGDNQ